MRVQCGRFLAWLALRDRCAPASTAASLRIAQQLGTAVVEVAYLAIIGANASLRRPTVTHRVWVPSIPAIAATLDSSAVAGRNVYRLRVLPWSYGRSSYGAPVPDEPANSLVPSGSVTSRPLALLVPSIAR